MRVKVHISILILILTFLGVASQQHITVANQEIVLQFIEAEVTSQEAQKTLASVKSQLLDLGVEGLIIHDAEAGKLKITYYSEVAIANVKAILYKENKSPIDYAFNNPYGQNQPKEDTEIHYNIDVFEIQNSNDVDFGFKGCVLEKQAEFDRYFDPNVFSPLHIINSINNETSISVSFKIWRHLESSIDNYPHSFPEVRAGPYSRGNS